ncbi:hypothetical protein CANINC_001418 [Pichia inconspicua]|uniref:CST complex subunit Stn1 N-terminal domain-containing protein n=1 Tax=Pichia inconspicua TaxID=52247 RepID=A0A4T0X4M6_9ASCO|nr:hypothetical protein CANINC_001418 [[Candida] inconspicua]
MDLITAAKRKLQKNTTIKSPTDSIVELRHNNIPYYKPSFFHLSWTLTRPVNITVRDVHLCRRVSSIYRHIGTRLDNNGMRLLNNWPLQSIRVVGRITSVHYLDDDNTKCKITIDDGTAENNTLTVYTEANVTFGITIEVIGIFCRYNAVNAKSVKRVWLNDQIEWWSQMLTDRDLLQQHWVLEETPSFSTELELIHETEQPFSQPPQIINLELPEMKLIDMKGNITVFEEWLYTVTSSTPAALQGRVMHALIAESAVTFSQIYNAPSVRTLLNRLLLEKFVTNVIPLSDELIYAEWAQLRLQDSKRVLLRTVLADIGVPTDDPPELLHQETITSAITTTKTLFNNSQNKRVLLSNVKALLPERASLAATVAFVAGLVTRGIINDIWVYSAIDKAWVYMP